MSNFARLAVAAALVAGFGSIAQAESHSRRVTAAQDRYDALYLGRDEVTDPTTGNPGAVAPSESHTVMGLRVPR